MTAPPMMQPILPPVDPSLSFDETPAADSLAVLDAELDALIPAHAVEVEPPDGSFNSEALHDLGLLESVTGPEDPEPPSIGEELGLGDIEDPLTSRAIGALYGYSFPLLKPEPRDDDWVAWAEDLWMVGSAGVQQQLHLVDRNRKMRAGLQHISSIGMGPWREPPKPKEAARVTRNMIAPALDQRVQIVTEQRPGWRVKPENQEQRNVKKAEAQQIALEYQYDQQGMRNTIRELEYWAGTDAVAFGCVYWEPDRGAWDEVFVPTGQQDENGAEMYRQTQHPKGDLCTKVYRIEQVRVSPNASSTRKPWYWVVKETIPLGEAVLQYGPEVADSSRERTEEDIGVSPGLRLGSILPDHDELLRDRETVDRITVYLEKSSVLAEGLTVVIVGRKLVAGPYPLLFGCVPLFRWTDGSTDPAFYPRAVMDGWIDAQMRINALLSKWVEFIRLNAGTKLLARTGQIETPTLVGGTMTLIGVKGMGPLGDTVQPLNTTSISEDMTELLAAEIKSFEDLTGWNDTSRGSFQSDPSGRAILAQREMLERIFAPAVNAAAEGMTEWAKITIAGMRWGYDEPRMVSVEGAGRPDLARELVADDFDGVPNITVDPESLMPLPRALRLFLLDTMLDKGVISLQEYRRRQPHAFVQNMDTPDTDHYARAKRVCEAIRNSLDPLSGMANPMALPILWQDEDAIHQDVLQRELILPDDLPPGIRSAAYQRWMFHAQQSAMKGGMTVGMPAGPPGAAGGEGGGMGASEQPFQGTNPSVAAGTSSQIGGASDEDSAARQFDATQQS